MAENVKVAVRVRPFISFLYDILTFYKSFIHDSRDVMVTEAYFVLKYYSINQFNVVAITDQF